MATLSTKDCRPLGNLVTPFCGIIFSGGCQNLSACVFLSLCVTVSLCVPLSLLSSSCVMAASGTQRMLSLSRRATVYVEPCDVFISHRGADTKRGLVGTITQRLKRVNCDPFMDEFGLQAGDSAWKTMKVRPVADLGCCPREILPCWLHAPVPCRLLCDSGTAADCSWRAGQA